MSRLAFALAVIVSVAPASALAQTAFDAAPMNDDTLKAVAGREDIGQAAFANQTNNVSNNSVTGNSVTGAVRIGDNAFQNISGLAVINVNSGNNVAINSAMNVTISLAPRN
ncbi:hypothetical protein F9288_07345 [Sphingomonas sp. CL5.1]|uniref:hypothetical protein n=1 Tax=Sphingomonas sp. CL5.1 TaxID=2653203 RepID=UPI001582F0E3|nr:hypothetical protein [Sphingomonas sp. CL5.1]QKR99477.1 hypothetical protein F9288_07345 [Sphingomonas sp. CL5.1]